MKIAAFIPARKGSKRIPGKNRIDIDGDFEDIEDDNDKKIAMSNEEDRFLTEIDATTLIK